jgi:hypothetical protein
VALVAALGLIALLGILIAGALSSSIIARRAVWLSQSEATLSAAADEALGSALARWQESLLPDLPLGRATSIAPSNSASARVQVSVSATRLPDDVLWLVADARSAGLDEGRRRFGLVARFGVPGRLPPAGIVAAGGVRLASEVAASIDTTGDVDCAAARDTPDVLVAPGAAWTAGTAVRGATDARAADSATYYLTSRQRRWLDSATIVRAVAGDTTIAGGSYQGILLVGGALRITKPFSVTGIVIARGLIEGSDSLIVTGAIESFAPLPQTSITLSHGAIHYAPCVIARMLRRASPPRPVRERSWSEFF